MPKFFGIFKRSVASRPVTGARRIHGAGGHIRRLLLCVACLPVFYPVPAAAAAPTVEYQVKASLVFNFMHFIEWPPDAFSDDGQITVCLVGRDVYGNALRVLEREVVQGKSLAVKTYGLWYPVLADSCQVVIFSEQATDPVRQALVTLADKSVLSVGEAPGFLDEGGIIRFTIVEDTVRFEVNLSAAKRARLGISSKLLRLANTVVTSGGTDTLQ